MNIIKTISEWKWKPKKMIVRYKNSTTNPIRPGYKRIMALVEVDGFKYTRHVDVKI